MFTAPTYDRRPIAQLRFHTSTASRVSFGVKLHRAINLYCVGVLWAGGAPQKKEVHVNSSQTLTSIYSSTLVYSGIYTCAVTESAKTPRPKAYSAVSLRPHGGYPLECTNARTPSTHTKRKISRCQRAVAEEVSPALHYDSTERILPNNGYRYVSCGQTRASLPVAN